MERGDSELLYGFQEVAQLLHSFLFLCEKWASTGKNMPFSELLLDCNFLISPRATGRGGGVTSVDKSFFHCRQIQHAGFASIELQLFVCVQWRAAHLNSTKTHAPVVPLVSPNESRACLTPRLLSKFQPPVNAQ